MLKNISIKTELEEIDFANISFLDENEANFIVLKIRNIKKGKIRHSPIKIDRCCKRLNSQNTILKQISFIKDNIPRISCNTDEKIFFENYIQKRVPVMMIGCQEGWPAKEWTFKGITNVQKKLIHES